MAWTKKSIFLQFSMFQRGQVFGCKFNFSMLKVKSHIGNFERCRRLIAAHQTQGKNINSREIHSFLGWADRNTLRLDCNFRPLQALLADIRNRLLTDAFIAQKPLLIAKTSAVFFHLNYYCSPWMQYASSRLVDWIRNSKPLVLEEMLLVYRMLVELGWKDDPEALRTIRHRIIDRLSQEIEKRHFHDLGKFMEKTHRQLRVLLLDPQLEIDLITPLFAKLGALFQHQRLELDPTYNYVHTAMVGQLVSILKIPLSSAAAPTYHQLLRQTYDRYKGTLSHETNLQNVSRQFSRRGHSVFQIRFQRHLQELGFWFERNKIIGIHEFDILLKGRYRSDFQPFKRLGEERDLSAISCISEEEVRVYEGMDSIWKVEKKQLWDEGILVNLNGPFHQIYGDREGILRSQQIKGLIAASYGFKRFKMIQFKDWESSTPHNRAAAEYIQNVIAACT